MRHGLGEASDGLLTMSVSAASCVATWWSYCVVSKCSSSARCGTSVVVGGCCDSLGRDFWAGFGPSSTDVGFRDDLNSSTVLGVDWTRWVFLDKVGVCLLTRLRFVMFELPKVPSVSSCYTTGTINLECVATMTIIFDDSAWLIPGFWIRASLILNVVLVTYI